MLANLRDCMRMNHHPRQADASASAGPGEQGRGGGSSLEGGVPLGGREAAAGRAGGGGGAGGGDAACWEAGSMRVRYVDWAACMRALDGEAGEQVGGGAGQAGHGATTEGVCAAGGGGGGAAAAGCGGGVAGDMPPGLEVGAAPFEVVLGSDVMYYPGGTLISSFLFFVTVYHAIYVYHYCYRVPLAHFTSTVTDRFGPTVERKTITNVKSVVTQFLLADRGHSAGPSFLKLTQIARRKRRWIPLGEPHA